jgi:tetratricopeptide (TPR) repeat protein
MIMGLAWADLTRIGSGLIYLTSSDEQFAAPHDSRAMSLLKTAERVEQGAAFVYNAEGYRWFQQEKLLDAETSFLQALNKDHAHTPALNNLAIVSFAQGNPLQAASYLRRATQHDPDNGILHYNLGILMMHLNDPREAIREFRMASFIEPEAAAPLLQQAYLYNQIGEYANAEECARAAIQLDPSLTSARLTLGIVLYNREERTRRWTPSRQPCRSSLKIEWRVFIKP